jgi:hypothetical protein
MPSFVEKTPEQIEQQRIRKYYVPFHKRADNIDYHNYTNTLLSSTNNNNYQVISFFFIIQSTYKKIRIEVINYYQAISIKHILNKHKNKLSLKVSCIDFS